MRLTQSAHTPELGNTPPSPSVSHSTPISNTLCPQLNPQCHTQSPVLTPAPVSRGHEDPSAARAASACTPRCGPHLTRPRRTRGRDSRPGSSSRCRECRARRPRRRAPPSSRGGGAPAERSPGSAPGRRPALDSRGRVR